MVVVDAKATAPQRAAIESVAQGKETEPGSLITQVFSTTLTAAPTTQVKPIELKIDKKAGTASMHVKDLIESSVEPIKNPITGAVHRARVSLPTGFEYTEAEFLTGSGKTTGPIKLDFNGTHAHIAQVHWSTHGLVRG
jgi:hypothetical protein